MIRLRASLAGRLRWQTLDWGMPNWFTLVTLLTNSKR